ncbi:hypothetical protein L1987_17832 [Smallanthus sonchifolius]|uniref:Uncharacterized protein n=1 Tax=Smallanthus sonchifolius TaxID=185202 RepID=A0ACB9J039_9ASTR|nr:hypothetical protein L1987_17832 [Smallanthus sonchifolius]
MTESIKIIQQALEGILGGPYENLEIRRFDRVKDTVWNEFYYRFISKKLSPTFELSKQELYARVEAPKGELRIFLIGDKGVFPWRYKIRPPGFVNLQIIPQLVKRMKLADIMTILGPLGILQALADAIAIAPAAADPFKLAPADDGASAGAASDASAPLSEPPVGEGGDGVLLPPNGDGGEELWDLGDSARCFGVGADLGDPFGAVLGAVLGAAFGGAVLLDFGALDGEVAGAAAETKPMRAMDMRARITIWFAIFVGSKNGEKRSGFICGFEEVVIGGKR